MQRKENESFADYKVRRAASNTVLKIERKRTASSGNSARHQLRHPSAIMVEGKLVQPKSARSYYGESLRSAFSKAQCTPERLSAHKTHVDHIAARKAARLAAATQ